MPENPRIEELRRRVLADPASIAFAALAEEFRRIGALDDAIETCRTGLQRHPAYLSARVTLGRALIETGDYEGARQELETVLRSAPENLAAIRGLEQIKERLDHSTEMDPHLAELMRQEAERVALAPPPAPVPVPVVQAAPEVPAAPPEPEPEPEAEPEYQAAAPEIIAAPEPEPQPEPEPEILTAPEPEPEILAAPEPEPEILAVPEPEPEPAIAFEPEPEPEPVFAIQLEPQPEPGPDPHVLATLARLERFLAAVETARHA